MFDFGINVLLNPSSFIGPANQVIGVINQLQAALSKLSAGTAVGGGLEAQFNRLNQAVAQSKTNLESFSSVGANVRSSMSQIGQATSQAAQQISIFSQKTNEAIGIFKNVETAAKSLAAGLSPLGNILRNTETTLNTLGPAVTGATQGISIFGQRTNEASTNIRNAEATFKSLGPAFSGISTGASAAGTSLTNVGNSAKAATSAITPLSNIVRNAEVTMKTLGPATQQAGQGFAIFSTRTNEAMNSARSAEALFKSLGPAFSGIASGANTASTSLTNVGNAAKTVATSMTPLGNIMRNTASQIEAAATAANSKLQILASTSTNVGNAFRAGLGSGIASIGGPLNNLNAQLSSTSGGLNNLAGSAQKATGPLGQLREMFSGNRGLVFGASALFGTITGIAFEFALWTDASKQVADSQAVVNDLVQQGRQGTAQYSQAVQALGKDQRFLEFSQRNMALAITNLIPDVLLIINGIIQLGDKMKAAKAGADTLATGMTAVQTSMTATNTASTAVNTALTETATAFTTTTTATQTFSSAGTAVTSSLTPMRGALSTTNITLAETVIAEEAATLSATGMVGSNAEMGLSAQGASKAIQSIVPAAEAVEGAEATLIEENVALGASFDALGVQAKAAGANLQGVGKAAGASGAGGAGGIRGAIGSILSRLGLAGGLGTGLAVGGGAAALVTIFYEFVLKPGAEATSQRILEEGKKLDAANKTVASSTDELVSKMQSGTESISEFWQLMSTSVAAEADKIVAKKNEIDTAMAKPPAGAPPVAEPGKPLVRQGYQPGTPARTYEELTGGSGVDPNAQAFAGTKLGGVAKTVSGGTIVPGQKGVASQFTTEGQGAQADATRNLYLGPQGVEAERLLKQKEQANAALQQKTALPVKTPQELFAQLQTQQAESALMATLQKKVSTPAGTFPLAGPITGKQFGELQGLGAQAAELSKAPAGEEKGSEAQMQRLEKFSATMQKIRDITTDTTAADKAYEDEQKTLQLAQENTGKQVQATEEALHAHNEQVLAMPRALAEATGQELEYSRAVQTAMGPAVVRDKQLDAHIALMAQQSAAYTSVNAVQGESLQVQEQVVAVGNEIIGGAEKQADAIRGVNIFWNEMNTSMQGSLLSSQQMSLASVDVTRSLTNQTEHQFLVNEGLIAGKQAAQEFLQQSIMGAAQNAQYVESLQGIITAMGIDIPEGMKLTAQQSEAVINAFNETGSAAGVFADIINERIQPAVQRLGDVLTAKSWKEFKDAFKGLEFGDTPDKLVNKFKNFDNMLRKINEDGREMQTVFDQMDIMQSLGKLDVKTFSQGLDAMAKQVEHIGKLQDIDVSNITDFIKDVKDMKDPNALVKFHDIFALISADAQNGYTSQELEDIQNKIDQMKADGLIKVKNALDAIVVSAKAALDPVFAITSKTGNIGPAANLTLGEQVSNEFGKIVTKGPKDETPVPDSKAVQTATAAINTALASTQTAFANLSNQGTNSIALLVGHLKAHMTTLTTYFAKTIPTELAASQIAFANFAIQGSNSIALLVGRLKAHMTTLTTYFAKTIPTDLAASQIAFANFSIQSTNSVALLVAHLKAHITTITTYFGKTIPTNVALSQVAFANFALQSSASMALLIAHLKSHITTITTYFTKTIPTNLQTGADAFALFSENASNAMAILISNLKAHITTITTYFTKTIPDDLQTAADAWNTFAEDVTKTMASFISMLKAHITTIGTYFTKTIPDDLQTAADAASQFASDFESSMSDVETAANNAMSAVSNLADEVGQLDGMTATVTVTTNFKTTGTPPKQTGDVTINKQMGAVIDAASPKSFQYGGSIETSHGPQMAIFGDNPGGQETVAFIPHDNPFPTLRKLEKLFKGRSSSDIVSNALDKAEQIVINATFVIENIMDGQKVGTTIAKRVFKKMRTR